jgi:hypothetical protein
MLRKKKPGTKHAAIWIVGLVHCKNMRERGIPRNILMTVREKSHRENGVCMPGLWIKAFHVLDLPRINISGRTQISYKNAASHWWPAFHAAQCNRQEERRAGFLQFLF